MIVVGLDTVDSRKIEWDGGELNYHSLRGHTKYSEYLGQRGALIEVRKKLPF